MIVICPKNECKEPCSHRDEHHRIGICDSIIGYQNAKNSCPACTEVVFEFEFIESEEMEI
jgi:hypothetical protein